MVVWMEPGHRQHVAIVKVDVDHLPVHILQLAHLVFNILQLFLCFFALVDN